MDGMDDTDLYPYQRDCLAFLEGSAGRALIADEMGLGKSAEALRWLARHPALRPTLVVCPKVMKLKWTDEVKRWSGEASQVLASRRAETLTQANYYIANYDILAARWVQIAGLRPAAIIIDECQYAKERRAARSKALARLCLLPSVKAVMGLSGTPLMNHPWELWHVLHLIRPERWPNWWAFIQRYCGARRQTIIARGGVTRSVLRYDGRTSQEELAARLRPMMIRRRKADVLPDLPPKTRVVVPVSVDADGAYKRVEAEAITELRKRLANPSASLPAAIDVIARLRHALGVAKLDAAQEFVLDTLDASDRVVVYAHHRAVVGALAERIRGSATISGETTATARSEAIRQFREGSVRLLIVSTRAGGIGIDLTEADTSVCVELDFNPAILVQAEDRLHRIGTKRPVFNYYLVGRRTIDEPMLGMLEGKVLGAAQILGDPEADFVGELRRWLRVPELVFGG